MNNYIYRHFAIFYDTTEITEYFSKEEIENLRRIYDVLDAHYGVFFTEYYQQLKNDPDHVCNSYSARLQAAVKASKSLRNVYMSPNSIYYMTYYADDPEHMVLKFNGIRESSIHYVYENEEAIRRNLMDAVNLKTQHQIQNSLDAIEANTCEMQKNALRFYNALHNYREEH